MLRITAGQFKGKRLELPPESITRPSSDRLRQAVFNILGNHLDWRGIKVLDAFAGSGALGLEALSRGAEHGVFCENNLLVQKILQKNISTTLKEDSGLASVHSDLFKLIQYTQFDLVFLDPPYDKSLEIKAIEHLIAYNLLNQNAIIVVEQRKNATPLDIAQLPDITFLNKHQKMDSRFRWNDRRECVDRKEEECHPLEKGDPFKNNDIRTYGQCQVQFLVYDSSTK